MSVSATSSYVYQPNAILSHRINKIRNKLDHGNNF